MSTAKQATQVAAKDYQAERRIEDALCARLQARGVKFYRQMPISLMRVDVVTAGEIYEVKKDFSIEHCVKALGQLLFYSQQLPSRQMVMVAGGYCPPAFKQVLRANGIKVKSLNLGGDVEPVEQDGEDAMFPRNGG